MLGTNDTINANTNSNTCSNIETLKAKKKAEIQNLNQELMKAAAEGNLEAVKKLVFRGADIYFKGHPR